MGDSLPDTVENVDGVRYTTFHGAKFRVVFDHNAPVEALAEVQDHVGQEGKMGATQEHLPCVEYPAGEKMIDATPEYNPPSVGKIDASLLTGPPTRDGCLYLALRVQRLGVKDRLYSTHNTPVEAYEAIIDHAGEEPEDCAPDWPDGNWGDEVWGWNTEDGATYLIQQYRWSGVDVERPPAFLTEAEVADEQSD